MEYPNVTENNLTIHWTVEHKGGYDTVNYSVMWSTDSNFAKDGTGFNTLTSTVTFRPNTQHSGNWTLKDLTAGRLYYVLVKAENCVGSKLSKLMSFCTHCGELLVIF